jgi:hypothetical protein
MSSRPNRSTVCSTARAIAVSSRMSTVAAMASGREAATASAPSPWMSATTTEAPLSASRRDDGAADARRPRR